MNWRIATDRAGRWTPIIWADAAQQAAATTEDDQARAEQTALEADRAETEARERFQVAQKDGFPKD